MRGGRLQAFLDRLSTSDSDSLFKGDGVIYDTYIALKTI